MASGGKLILIADDAEYAELHSAGAIRAPWFCETDANGLTEKVREPPPWALRCSPSLFIPPVRPDGKSPRAEVAGEQTELLFGLLDTTVCYLAIVDAATEESPDGGETRNTAKAVPADSGDRTSQEAADQAAVSAAEGDEPRPPARPVAFHLAWYRKFREILDEQLDKRACEVHHVLVLICRSSPLKTELPALKQLLGDNGNSRLFDNAYVMLEELEPGGTGAASYFRAEHVWPIAVSGLLLRLLHWSEESYPSASPVCAWRCCQLVPTINTRLRENVCSHKLKELLAEIYSPRETGTGLAGLFGDLLARGATARDDHLKPPPAGEGGDEPWLDYDAATRLEQFACEDRWQPLLNSTGEQIGEHFNRELIQNEPPPLTEVSSVWQQVHTQPGAIGVALAAPGLLQGDNLEGQFQAIRDGWEAILDQDRRHVEQTQVAAECAKHLAAAQDGFVNLAWRLVIAAVVTLFVGYLAMVVLRNLSGAWFVPLLVATGGGLGAFLAALLTETFEQEAGRRAKRDFEAKLADLDRITLARHTSCVKTVILAHEFWQRLWAKAAASRVKQLLERLRAMLDRELRYRPEVEAQDGDVTDVEDEQSASRLQRRQRDKFRRETLWACPFTWEERETHEMLAELVREKAQEFLELWTAFADEHDRDRLGHFPARALIPRLRRFRDEFQAEVLASIGRHVLTQSPSEEQLSAWLDPLWRLSEVQQFFEFLSCRVLSHQTTEAPCHLFLRGGLADFAERVGQRNSPRKPLVHSSSYFTGLPIAGLFFQEMPVTFDDQGRDGRIGVAPYRENPARQAAPQNAAPAAPDPQATATAPLPKEKPQRRPPAGHRATKPRNADPNDHGAQP